MNITVKKDEDPLVLGLLVEVDKADYEGEFLKALRDIQKSANLPGFRTGRVPLGLIRKQYGQSVFLDQIQDILSKQIITYLNSMGLRPMDTFQVLNPITYSSKTDTYVFDVQQMLRPELDVDLTKVPKQKYYNVSCEESDIEESIAKLRDKFATKIQEEKVGEKSIVLGDFRNTQNDKKAQDFDIHMEDLPKQWGHLRELLIGLQVGEEFLLSKADVIPYDFEASQMLGINEEKKEGEEEDEREGENGGDTAKANNTLDSTQGAIVFKVKEIYQKAPAALDEDFFNKAFEGRINTEEMLRARLINELNINLTKTTRENFIRDVESFLMDKISMEFSEPYLDRLTKIVLNTDVLEFLELLGRDRKLHIAKMHLIGWEIIDKYKLYYEDSDLFEHAIYFLSKELMLDLNDPDNRNKLELMAVKIMTESGRDKQEIAASLLNKMKFTCYKEKVPLEIEDISLSHYSTICKKAEERLQVADSEV